MTAIGFVGLGAMGGRIAGRLLDAGNTVYGTNRTRSSAEPLVERGMIWRDSPREVAEQAEVISGSVPAAQEGTLAIMVGGDAAAFAHVEPLLRQLGRTVTHVGENGKALMVKLAVNISLAAQMIAFSEGVLLAERGGVDPALVIEVLTSSAIGSPMLSVRGPLVLDRPEQAWFDVKLMHKDIGLALAQGRKREVPLPSTALANELFTAARALGYGDQDMVAVFDVLAQLAGRKSVAA